MTDDEIKRLLTPPARRGVNEMKLQISEIGPGSHVGATFTDSVFGVYAVRGEVARASHGDLVLSVYSIESNGRPSNDVLRLDTSGRSYQAIGPREAALTLDHGTIVRATFLEGEKTFDVLGPAVTTTGSSMTGVGRWVLAHKGAVGRSLKAMDIIAPCRDLGLLCPSPVMSWDTSTNGTD
ncbi:hypothetical protein [Mycolicibacter icosiumassiliensis]|uniref:hypothetical protein n=1 Tax=Mycolicibacter icosiumassiliensis TaxID=1792835 RepID=UPI00082EE8A7|nr:hypothetical protein [Mycolicibacter icosiumassiliensis]